MSKQLVQNVKGTRDFYPEDMAFRRWLLSKIREVSESFGYQEFDGPEIEYLDLYADKTSEEILKEQAFMTEDRDGQKILLRPEITPTFARMVAQKSRELLRPIRWYSFGRCWRYEKPQKGRTREFFQWEINILGPETPQADAEIIALAARYFRTLGLTSDEVVIRISDRSYFDQILKENGINEEKFMPLLRVIDRKEKVNREEFDELLRSEGLNDSQISALNAFFENKDFSKSEWLSSLFNALSAYGDVLPYVEYDPTIARGFDYYTRTVFEAWDRTGGLRRALFGGGRFDNLTATIGGERVPGVGMAPGDVPIQVLLEQFNKVPQQSPITATVLVSVFNSELINRSLKIASQLRDAGINTECWPDGDTKLEKQVKYADQKGISYLVIAGPDEVAQNSVLVKNLSLRTQELVSTNNLIQAIK